MWGTVSYQEAESLGQGPGRTLCTFICVKISTTPTYHERPWVPSSALKNYKDNQTVLVLGKHLPWENAFLVCMSPGTHPYLPHRLKVALHTCNPSWKIRNSRLFGAVQQVRSQPGSMTLWKRFRVAPDQRSSAGEGEDEPVTLLLVPPSLALRSTQTALYFPKSGQGLQAGQSL